MHSPPNNQYNEPWNDESMDATPSFEDDSNVDFSDFGSSPVSGPPLAPDIFNQPSMGLSGPVGTFKSQLNYGIPPQLVNELRVNAPSSGFPGQNTINNQKAVHCCKSDPSTPLSVRSLIRKCLQNLELHSGERRIKLWLPY